MKVDPDDLKRWGHDDLTKIIDQHVSTMPDRPKVVVTIIVNGRDFDEANAQALKPLAPHYFNTQPVLWLGAAFRIIYLGFDAAESDAFLQFWAIAATMPRLDEMALYIDGKAEFRIDRLIHGPPPPGSDLYEEPVRPYEP